MDDLIDRFWQRVQKGDGCWLWTKSVNGAGYGSYKPIKKESTKLAHRLAWEIVYGPIPVKMCVLHMCDNKLCVNPEHLFLGTHGDNTHDMMIKGRRRSGPPLCGEANPNVKLSRKQVLEIREIYKTGDMDQYELAEHFHVSQSLIWAITSRKLWRDC